LSEIEANEKLREAKYFLEQMRRLDFMGFETGVFEDKEFSYNFDAFIVAWHSVLDILRFDFAERFSLGITRQERASRDYFRHLAKGLASKNPKDFSEAAAFYEWMDRQEDGLLKRHASLREKRYMVAHRGTVKTGVKEEVTEWAVNVSTYGVSTYSTALYSSYSAGKPGDSVQAGSIPAQPAAAWAGRVVKDEPPPTLPDRTVRLHKTRAYTYFKDDPEELSIVSICSSAYEDMAQLVTNAEKGSWKAASAYERNYPK